MVTEETVYVEVFQHVDTKEWMGLSHPCPDGERHQYDLGFEATPRYGANGVVSKCPRTSYIVKLVPKRMPPRQGILMPREVADALGMWYAGKTGSAT